MGRPDRDRQETIGGFRSDERRGQRSIGSGLAQRTDRQPRRPARRCHYGPRLPGLAGPSVQAPDGAWTTDASSGSTNPQRGHTHWSSAMGIGWLWLGRRVRSSSGVRHSGHGLEVVMLQLTPGNGGNARDCSGEGSAPLQPSSLKPARGPAAGYVASMYCALGFQEHRCRVVLRTPISAVVNGSSVVVRVNYRNFHAFPRKVERQKRE